MYAVEVYGVVRQLVSNEPPGGSGSAPLLAHSAMFGYGSTEMITIPVPPRGPPRQPPRRPRSRTVEDTQNSCESFSGALKSRPQDTELLVAILLLCIQRGASCLR